jgi:hypothetical protein
MHQSPQRALLEAEAELYGRQITDPLRTWHPTPRQRPPFIQAVLAGVPATRPLCCREPIGQEHGGGLLWGDPRALRHRAAARRLLCGERDQRVGSGDLGARGERHLPEFPGRDPAAVFRQRDGRSRGRDRVHPAPGVRRVVGDGPAAQAQERLGDHLPLGGQRAREVPGAHARLGASGRGAPRNPSSRRSSPASAPAAGCACSSARPCCRPRAWPGASRGSMRN